jgi:ATP synthase I subunit
VLSPSIHRIERLNYGLSAALIALAALTQTRAVALGLAVGCGLTCLNFYVLRRLVVKWTDDAARRGSGNSTMLYLPKMIAMMGAVAAAVLLLPIDIIAFIVGYSIFIVSIIVDSTYTALRPSAADPVPGPPDPATTNSENTDG